MDIYLKNSVSQPQNNLNIVKLSLPGLTGGYQLPEDVTILINGNKMINQSQILDGVTVFERVTRKAFEIDFEFVMRDKTVNQPNVSIGNISYNQASVDQWVFPLFKTYDFYQQIWRPDQVLKVENSFLNALDIYQIVIQDINITTLRGSTDVPIKLKCIEDYYSVSKQGTTLI